MAEPTHPERESNPRIFKPPRRNALGTWDGLGEGKRAPHSPLPPPRARTAHRGRSGTTQRTDPPLAPDRQGRLKTPDTEAPHNEPGGGKNRPRHHQPRSTVGSGAVRPHRQPRTRGHGGSGLREPAGTGPASPAQTKAEREGRTQPHPPPPQPPPRPSSPRPGSRRPTTGVTTHATDSPSPWPVAEIRKPSIPNLRTPNSGGIQVNRHTRARAGPAPPSVCLSR